MKHIRFKNGLELAVPSVHSNVTKVQVLNSSVRPQRIRLSRQRGFDLQAESLALNGLPAVNCARPSKWGNPFRITPERSQILAVGAFKTWLTVDGVDAGMADRKKWILENLHQLRGKNLACFCRPQDRCHCDVLLDLVQSKFTNW